MKTLKLFLLCILTLSMVACDEDDFFDRDDRYLFEVESTLAGRDWTGDVGGYDEFGERTFSTFCFGLNGRGDEYQYYKSDGLLYRHYTFRWYTEYCLDCGACSVILDYGGGDKSFMDDVHFSGRSFYGIYYFDRKSEGYRFNLRMEN